MYTLIMSNDQGASEETRGHKTKTKVRSQIRTWQAKGMRAVVIDTRTYTVIYEGSALGFK